MTRPEIPGEDDPEKLGRFLLERQSPAERDQSRQIFDRLLRGEDPEDLKDEYATLARLRVDRLERRRRDTQWS
jgi:hypothetical protein